MRVYAHLVVQPARVDAVQRLDAAIVLIALKQLFVAVLRDAPHVAHVQVLVDVHRGHSRAGGVQQQHVQEKQIQVVLALEQAGHLLHQPQILVGLTPRHELSLHRAHLAHGLNATRDSASSASQHPSAAPVGTPESAAERGREDRRRRRRRRRRPRSPRMPYVLQGRVVREDVHGEPGSTHVSRKRHVRHHLHPVGTRPRGARPRAGRAGGQERRRAAPGRPPRA